MTSPSCLFSPQSSLNTDAEYAEQSDLEYVNKVPESSVPFPYTRFAMTVMRAYLAHPPLNTPLQKMVEKVLYVHVEVN